MKILVIGSRGQLGTDMVTEAAKAGHAVRGVDYPEIDITNLDATRTLVTKSGPDVLINCSAYTAVDACESHESEARAVNATGVKNLATCARERGSTIVHYSTDYVFDGTAQRPYVESDTPNPATAYGRTKLLGEQMLANEWSNFFIFRIAWLYGVHGTNFVKTIRNAALKKLAANEPLTVVNDQFGTPTWTIDVCLQTLAMIPTTHFGLYHATSEGACSWFDFAKRIVESANIPVSLLPCTTAMFKRPAPRPAFSVLENRGLKTLGMNVMPDWNEGFRGFLKAESPEKALHP